MARRALSGWRPWCLSFAIWLGLAGTVYAAALDEKGEISLGVRAYTAARIGTENTDVEICYGEGRSFKCGGSNGLPPVPTTGQTFKSLTFPVSPAGHLRQNRFYVEAELDHNLQRLLEGGLRPLCAAQRSAVQASQIQIPPDVPRRGRGHLRLRPGRIPDRVPILQQDPRTGLLGPDAQCRLGAPAAAQLVRAP